MIVLNDLYDYNLKIYQDNNKFKFSLDSLLLAEFVNVSKKDHNLLDLCSGNAPLPLILASRTNLSITGVELQKDIYDLALKSIKYNHLEKRITLINDNVKDINNYFPGNNFDIITCNPPFFKTTSTSLINENYEKALARHELTVTLEDIFKVSSTLLNDKGKFYLVHRPERLEEIILLAHKYHLTLKNIKFITKESESCAIMMLLFFTKNGRPGTKVSTKIINRDTKTYQNIFN